VKLRYSNLLKLKHPNYLKLFQIDQEATVEQSKTAAESTCSLSYQATWDYNGVVYRRRIIQRETETLKRVKWKMSPALGYMDKRWRLFSIAKGVYNQHRRGFHPKKLPSLLSLNQNWSLLAKIVSHPSSGTDDGYEESTRTCCCCRIQYNIFAITIQYIAGR
jgi:hypothetical protein